LDGLGEHRKFAEKIKLRRAEIAQTLKRAQKQFLVRHNNTGTDFKLIDEGLSSKTGLTQNQTVFLASLALLTVTGFIFLPNLTMVILAAVFSFFYLSVVLFRAWVLADFGKQPIDIFDFSDEMPQQKYVILSALYKEPNMIGDLITSLDRLRWSKGKKEVYFLCEASDQETVSAIEKQTLPDGFFLIIVPEGKLRTKPRALNYALRRVEDDYLVIYDAEDRPHPDQLLEAVATFNKSSDQVVCLQAPLTIDNEMESILTRLFAIEYITLFHGILPAIANHQAPMPLGGTSNHFKLKDLKEAGGWDSYNVTEDADLGIRLARKGKLCDVINLPTYEEAPTDYVAWTKQRTRWLKGWMQTLLVHLRQPARLFSDIGPANFFKFNMILTSVVVSVLIHPLFLGAFIFQITNYFSGNSLSTYEVAITGLSTFNLVAGYTTYGALAFATLRQTRKQSLQAYILLLPIYWLMVSVAGWRAIYQLIFSPHNWEKTSHGSKNRPPIENQISVTK